MEVTQRILDANSNLEGLIDPNGNPSSNTYDPFNRLETNTHREGGISTYEYDDQDRIIKVIAPNGVETDYEYDIISRRTKEISPDRGTMTYDYDLANNVTSITEGRGITASMSYDELERVETKTYPNTIAGKNENVTYTYDSCSFGLGFLCARTDESGSYRYNYDAYGNMSDGNFTEIEGTLYTMNYQYDDSDHITQMTLPSGRVVDYTRDGVRRVEGIDTTLNGTAQTIVSNIQYRGDNQMLSCDYGNRLSDTRTYDLQGRLLSQQLEDAINTIIDQRTYTYDKNSNLINIDTNLEDNAYGYDKLDRLTSDTIDTNTPIGYTYDQNDNRLTETLGDLTLEELYEQQANNNRLSVVESVLAGATPIQNLPNRDLIYNDVGRLFQLIEEGILKAEYIYNDAGQRTRKTVYQSDGLTIDNITIYHYDQMGYLVTETNEQGNLIKDYLWQEGMTPVAQITAMDGGNTGNAGAVGSEIITYLYTDHLMTNRLATDSTQSVVWRWEGEAFGNTLAQELAGISVNLRFPGQYFDEETNLHYNMFRYYDPTLGRYITSDPIGISAGMNTYNYANMNPIIGIDPLGLATYRYGGIRYSDRYDSSDPTCEKAVHVGDMVIWKLCTPGEECDDNPEPNPSPNPNPNPYQPPGGGPVPGYDGGGEGVTYPKPTGRPRGVADNVADFGAMMMCSSGPVGLEIITSVTIGLAKIPYKAKQIATAGSGGGTGFGIGNCYNQTFGR